MATGNLTALDISIAEIPANIVESLWSAFLQLYSEFVTLLPGIIVAFFILLVGWIVAKLSEKVVTKALRKVGIDDWLKKNKLHKALGEADLTKILGTLTKWYILLIFLSQIVEWVKLTALQVFLQHALIYLPSLFGAALIVIIGVFIGEYLKKTSMDMQLPYYELTGGLMKFLVSYMALVIGLQTAGIDAGILLQAFNIGFLGLVLTLSLAFGIGFGLALKSEAEKIVKNVKKKL